MIRVLAFCVLEAAALMSPSRMQGASAPPFSLKSFEKPSCAILACDRSTRDKVKSMIVGTAGSNEGAACADVDEGELIATAYVPQGAEMRLVRFDDEFVIRLEDTDLMSTGSIVSEEALGTMTCERLAGRAAPQVLIGGYGMGFTLRSTLAVLAGDAQVTVAEIVPEIIEWARGPMRHFTGDCLSDPRVVLVQDDVAILIDAAREGYDAIVLDVDNGPEGLTRDVNDWLYSGRGIHAAREALKPGGLLAIWSAEPDAGFFRMLEDFEFDVSEVTVHSRAPGEGTDHVIWFARKPG